MNVTTSDKRIILFDHFCILRYSIKIINYLAGEGQKAHGEEYEMLEEHIPSRRSKAKKEKEKSPIREMAEVVIIALVLAFLIKPLLSEIFGFRQNLCCRPLR